MSPDPWLEENIGYEILNPGLERIRQGVALLELDFSQRKIITIGGTNGKGQTSRLIYSELAKSFSASLWTSPHLVSVTERFSKNGQSISEVELLEIFASIRSTLKKAKLELSYYEFLFLCFLQFSKESEYLVLEVGLGGRFDAVNALDADTVLLTSVSRDHQEYLGPRLEGILDEKIQLARSGKSLITNFETSYLRRLAREHCQANGIKHWDLFELQLSSKEDSFSCLNHKIAGFCLEQLGAKLGDFSSDPSSGALVKFEIEAVVCHGLTSHNPDGVRKGVQFLLQDKYTNNKTLNYQSVLLSFSKRPLGDALAMIGTLKLWKKKYLPNAQIILCPFEHPKAMEAKDVEALAKRCELNFVSEPKKFFNDTNKFLQAHNISNPPVLVIGSNYFIGALCALSKDSEFSRK